MYNCFANMGTDARFKKQTDPTATFGSCVHPEVTNVGERYAQKMPQSMSDPEQGWAGHSLQPLPG